MSTDLITEHLDLWTSAITYNNGKGKGRGKNGESELTGIQKLRELILELAVRGKLVPQDPEDEPASKLLERIEVEKARLYKEGKIKKPKKLPEVTEEEKPFELPPGWKWVRLGNIGQIVGGGTPKSGEPSFWSEDGVKWLTPADLYGFDEKYIFSGRRDISWEGLERSSATLMPKGSVLFSSRAPIGYVAIAGGPLSTNQGFKSCVPYVEGMSEYLFYFLKRSGQLIHEAASGTTFKEISGSKMAQVLVALPPQNEQSRIVEKVDELMALCDRLEQQTSDQISAHETLVDTLLDTLTRSQDAAELAGNWARLAEHFDTLFTTEHSIDRLEQTILQLAVMGRLVPQDPNEEPASVLLERIEGEKERLVAEGRIKPPKKLSGNQVEEPSFQLPDGWVWVTLTQLGVFSGGKTPRKSNGDYWNGKIPWVTPKDMGSEDIFDSVDHVTDKAIQDGLDLHEAGGLLFVVRSGILRRSFPVAITQTQCAVNQDLKAVSFFDDKVNKYVRLMLKGYEKYIVANLTKTGTTVESLKVDEFVSQKFPLPPFEEQNRIIKKVDELMALCEHLKAHLIEANKVQTELAESIVNKAVA